MNPKKKSLRKIIEKLAQDYWNYGKRDLIDTEKITPIDKTLSTIKAHIDKEVKVARAHQEMETYCAMKKKYKSEADFEIHCEHAEKNVLSSDCVYCDLALAKETIKKLKARRLSEEEIKRMINSNIDNHEVGLLEFIPECSCEASPDFSHMCRVYDWNDTVKKFVDNLTHAIFKAQEEKLK